MSRFEKRIFPGEEIHRKRQLLTFNYDHLKKNSAYKGLLEELEVDLLKQSGCEKYPSLEMSESCKDFHKYF